MQATRRTERSPAWLLYVTTVVVVAEVAWATLRGFSAADGALRTVGGTLQILGLLGAGIGLVHRLGMSGVRGMLPDLVGRLREILAPKSVDVTITPVGFEIVAILDEARGRVKFGEGATVEDRLKRMEVNYEELDDAVAHVSEALKRADAEMKQALALEATRRLDAERALQQQLEEMPVHGIRLDVVGWVLMLVGTAISTWAPELSRCIVGLLK